MAEENNIRLHLCKDKESAENDSRKRTEYLLKMSEVNQKEGILDGNCKHLLRSGVFPRHLMEKFGLMRYAGKHGRTRIVIEYDNDTGSGWMRAVSECPERIPTLTDQ